MLLKHHLYHKWTVYFIEIRAKNSTEGFSPLNTCFCSFPNWLAGGFTLLLLIWLGKPSVYYQMPNSTNQPSAKYSLKLLALCQTFCRSCFPNDFAKYFVNQDASGYLWPSGNIYHNYKMTPIQLILLPYIHCFMTPGFYFILIILIFVNCSYVATFWKDWSKGNNGKYRVTVRWRSFRIVFAIALYAVFSTGIQFNSSLYVWLPRVQDKNTDEAHMCILVSEYVLTVSPLSLFLSLSFWQCRWAILCQSSQPKSHHHCDIWLPLFFVIRSNSYDSVKLAISIISSALAVGANIISHTLKATIITEQEPLNRPANIRVNNSELIKICHVWTEKQISIGWRTHGKLPCHLASDSDKRIKHCTSVKPVLIYILIWTMAKRCVRSNLEEN